MSYVLCGSFCRGLTKARVARLCSEHVSLGRKGVKLVFDWVHFGVVR